MHWDNALECSLSILKILYNDRDHDNLSEIKIAIYSSRVSKGCYSGVPSSVFEWDFFGLLNGKTIMTYTVAQNTPSAYPWMKSRAALQGHWDKRGNWSDKGRARSCPSAGTAPRPGYAGQKRVVHKRTWRSCWSAKSPWGCGVPWTWYTLSCVRKVYHQEEEE